MTLSDTQTSILQQAAQHPNGLVVSPIHLPPGPRASIARALTNAGLVTRAEPSDVNASWKLDGEITWLSITDAGRQAMGEAKKALAPASGVEGATADEADAAAHKATSALEASLTLSSPRRRPKLRDTAASLLSRWDATTEREPLADAVADLRTALGAAPRSTSSAFAPRQGTKQEAVLALLRRPQGATIASVVEATGWAQHTVRGFFAGLKKKGHTVEVLDRVRQNGPGNAGAKGSYSIYRLGEAG